VAIVRIGLLSMAFRLEKTAYRYTRISHHRSHSAFGSGVARARDDVIEHGVNQCFLSGSGLKTLRFSESTKCEQDLVRA
jgi:hypothetical protein